MLSPQQIETATLLAWPALDAVGDGAWQARFAAGYTKRANSIQCMDPGDDARAQSRLDALASLYGAHKLPAVFRVTPLTGPRTLNALDAQGWTPFEPSLVLSMPMGKTVGLDGAATLHEPTATAFRDVQASLGGFDAGTCDTLAQILGKLAVPATGIVLADTTGAPAASLLCVQSDGIAIFLCVVTAPALRGKGYGRRVMETGLSWAAENGAGHAALQVLSTNAQAISLYLRMGFTFRYPYHYRRRPEIEPQ